MSSSAAATPAAILPTDFSFTTGLNPEHGNLVAAVPALDLFHVEHERELSFAFMAFIGLVPPPPILSQNIQSKGGKFSKIPWPHLAAPIAPTAIGHTCPNKSVCTADYAFAIKKRPPRLRK